MNAPALPRQPEHSTAVTEAARWLATEPNPPRVAVPVLREQFGLTAKEACQAIKEAGLIRARAS
jgi:hypothetical protein